MKFSRWPGLVAGLALLVGVGLGGARQPEPILPPPKKIDPGKADLGKTDPGKVGPGAAQRDPTEPSPKLKDVLNPPDPEGKGDTAPRVMGVTLRGRVILRDKPPVALLEVGGKVYSVIHGGAFSAGGVIYRVISIDTSEVRLEAGSSKEIVRLR